MFVNTAKLPHEVITPLCTPVSDISEFPHPLSSSPSVDLTLFNFANLLGEKYLLFIRIASY